MKRSVISAAAAILLAMTPSACSRSAADAQTGPMPGLHAAAPETAQKAYTVKVSNFTFDKQVLTVPTGATVTWKNEDDVPHTVVSEDTKTFRSKTLDTDDSFSFTFTTAGEFAYFCSLHPHMTGKIIVKAS
jgi:plastocyanin